MNEKNKQGRIVYVGDGVKGLLGVIDGAELKSTYSWERVDYIVSSLLQVMQQNIDQPVISKYDFVIVLDSKIEFSCPKIDLSHYVPSVTNAMLKICTTLFALQNGWIRDGEMIRLDPKNPNRKLAVRRVQILKNLKIAETTEQAIKLLEKTDSNLAMYAKTTIRI